MGAGRKTGMASAFAGRNSVPFHSCSAGLHVLSLHARYVLDRRSGGLESEHGDFIAAVLDLLFLFDLWGGSLSGLYRKSESYIFRLKYAMFPTHIRVKDALHLTHRCDVANMEERGKRSEKVSLWTVWAGTGTVPAASVCV